MLRSDLCDCSDIHTYCCKRKNDCWRNNVAETRNKKLIFKNNTPFRSCISIYNNALIDDAEDLCIVMPMYNLLEYSDNYSITSRRLWSYYRDEINNDANENNAAHS